MHTRIGRSSIVLLLMMVVALEFVAGGAAAGAREAESVTGHADFVNATGLRFQYQVSAIRHADGSVSGEFENHVTNAATGEFILTAHVTIVCFTINGNVARIGGIIDRQFGLPIPPGVAPEGFITVVDNGEGHDAAPDLASPPALGPPFVHCETGLPRPLFPIERGNIQVRPSGL
jgi:hypothetical protein